MSQQKSPHSKWKIYSNSRFFTNRMKLTGLIVLVFLTVFLSLVLKENKDKYSYVTGDVVKESILAPFDMVDVEATERNKTMILNEVDPVEYVDSTIQVDVKKTIEKFFKTLFEVRQTYFDDTRMAQNIFSVIERNNIYGLDEDQLMYLAKINRDDLESIESYIYDIVLQVMSNGIKYENLSVERENIKTYFEKLEGFDLELKTIAIAIVNESIQENRFENIELTEKKRLEVASRIEDVVIIKGTPLVKSGDTVTENHLVLLKEADLLIGSSRFLRIDLLGIAMTTFVLITFASIYLGIEENKEKWTYKDVSMLTVLFIIVYLSAPIFATFSGYLVPLSLFPMTLSLISDYRRAIIAHVFLVLVVSLLVDATTGQIMVYLIGGIAGALRMRKADQRGAIFVAGLLVGVVNVFLILGLGLNWGWNLSTLLGTCGFGFAGGLLSSVLTIGLLPLWEYVFKIMTPIKLLELSNSNHPLLRKLLLEAPGTYHHSILVGNLSESAAHAIGANAMLARVGSYFHDVGKVKNAYFFKENQLTDDNPHDRITPEMSARIIKDHVQIGLTLADQHRLPEEIKEIIEQHHGSTLIKFFYHKALENNKDGESLGVSNFTYQGLTPRSKEAAIIMMADSMEAAARTLPEHNPESIRRLVKAIINDKLDSRQLTYCKLTFTDLDAIAEQFVSVLSGIYHERIEYPELPNENMEDT